MDNYHVVGDPELAPPVPTGEDISDSSVTFEESGTRANILSGETLATLFGKIKKWFTDLKTVAFTGSYNDLSNKPNLSSVATSGSYNDLSNKPTIPTNNNQLTNGAGYITSAGSCDSSTYSQRVRASDGWGSYFQNDLRYAHQTDIYPTWSTPWGSSVIQADSWISMGTSNRATQIIFGEFAHQRASYIRYFHDSGWSQWFLINTTSTSSKKAKTNVSEMTEEEAKKLLDVDIIKFDYTDFFGGEKDRFGTFAEDLYEIIPSAVNMPPAYNMDDDDMSEENLQVAPSIKYELLVPHLIKLVQIQEERISKLENILKKEGLL